jgi:solute carrier family 25 carnitine/acylcarnitine transporter 20/29
MWDWIVSSGGLNAVSGTIGGIPGTAMRIWRLTVYVAGVAGTIAGHPFDTLKVRLQCPTSSGRVTVSSAIRDVWREDGLRGYFRGMGAPLLGVATVNALLFGVYGGLMEWQRRLLGGEETWWNVAVAGAGSGFANSFVSGPTELIKTQLQLHRQPFSSSPMLDCARMIQARAGLRGYTRGLGATILRESPSYAVYFATFDGLQRIGLVDPAIGWQVMLAGGLSGITGWISTYPADVLKTRMQAVSFAQSARKPTYLQLARGILAEDGASGLFKGLLPTILRAFPTNAVIFWAYISCMQMLAGEEQLLATED